MLALAATVGCVDVLAELMDVRGCARSPDPDGQMCCAAASHGHLEVLRYAHEHGCPWDTDTCTCAAQGGHLEMLRYAREHGCPG